MIQRLGIRQEDKNVWERRVPLTPDHVRSLVDRGIEVVVQPSEIRAFRDAEYREAGAALRDDLGECPVILGVKEIPRNLFRWEHTYVFFAHVIKGQPHNMPMLRRLLELRCTLIDYEKVADDSGRRLVFFGRHAGLAGMIDTLWALGKRLEAEGIPNAFSEIRPTHEYPDLEAAKRAVHGVAPKLAASPLPPALTPLVFGFAGYGHVSLGAQEIFDLLPHREVEPGELERAAHEGSGLVKTVFKEEHMVRPAEPGRLFDLQEYYRHPERYRAGFDAWVPHLHVLVNCIYWEPRYPRLVTKERLRSLWGDGAAPRLRVIGDISCDVDGSIECTVRATDPGDPVYVWQPGDATVRPGVRGEGPVILAVDNLPCELALDASRDFGRALLAYVPDLVGADFSRPFDRLELPAPFKRAVIAHRGELTPEFRYLQPNLDTQPGGSV